MRMINRLLEDAADGRSFIDQLAGDTGKDGQQRRFVVVDDYRPGENRAQRRARQRAERRASRKVVAR